jgi:uncharacterized membrane protein YhhN
MEDTLIVLVIVLAVTSAAATAAGAVRSGAVLKMTAATGYLALALAGGALDTGYGRTLLIALLLCWLGDLLLVTPGRGPAFLGGLASFLVGHLAFAWAFHLRGVDYLWFSAGGVAAGAVGLGVARWLAAHDVPPRLRVPVGLYIAAIAVMVAAAVGTHGAEAAWIIPVGAAAFMASDVLVARERFVVSSPANVAVGLPLYFAAQVLLALSV